MKTISTRELRQNPSRMLHDVEGGEVYSLTLHGRQVATIVRSPMDCVSFPRGYFAQN